MLTTTSEHALRALASLATSTEGEPVLARDLSTHAEVPLTYLSKILGSMTKAGILHASRGPGGGYRLARAADQISLINIVEQFEGLKARPDCLLGGNRRCSDNDSCTAHESFKEVRQVYIDFLETTTIADIAGPTYVDGAPADELSSDEGGGGGVQG
ncbi:MAG: Rrf2 family transcriptional regulator [bacterium]|nr:Rrf2 family transcriptional regulator [bacterium]